MATGTGLAGVEAAVEAVVLPAVEAHGLTLVDLEFGATVGGWRAAALRRQAGRRHDRRLPAALSHEVGDLLDVSDLVRSSYDLEVSSPGLDRELRRDRELQWAIGRLVRSGCGSRWTATASSRAGSSWWLRRPLALDDARWHAEAFRGAS